MKSLYQALLTTEGLVLYANQALLDLRGVKLEDVAGKSVWNLPWTMPPEMERYQIMVNSVARTGIREEHRLLIKFPEGERSYDVEMSPVWTSDGAIIALMVEGNEANHVLNVREKDVLTWTARGKTSWEIASILGLSQRTVEWHATRAREKLEANNTIEAVAKAIKNKLICP